MKENGLPICEKMINKNEKPKQHGEVTNSAVKARCPTCGQPENIVWVHGHGQCTYCKMNVIPCCDGAASG